jgi:prepilin peptidase CpaA
MDISSILILSALLTVAAIIDLKTHRIPNWLTITAIICLLVNHTAVRGLSGFQFGLYGTFLGLCLLLIPYLLGWTGAGDVKLLSAVGCAVGAKGVVLAFLFSAMFGGLFAIISMKKHRGELGLNSFLIDEYNAILSFFYTKLYSPYGERKRLSEVKLPYGVAIACGTGLFIILRLFGLEFLST